jgi:uncharacterized protein YdeI (BOF family)
MGAGETQTQRSKSMKKIFRLFAALCLTSFALACGGTADEMGDESADDVKASASEPMTWIALAQKAAAGYAKDPALMNIEGNIGRGDTFTWQFTFADSSSMYVTVQCDGKTATVVSHQALRIRGMMSIDLSEVKVNFTKLEKIGAKNGLSGRILHVELAEPLTPNAHPHWTLQQGGKEIMVDAFNGAVLK